jgi:Leucine-rich repeat (LRR) protein
VIVLARPAGSDQDWQEVDRGPGYFSIPAGDEIRVRIKSIDDDALGELVSDLQELSALRFLDLAENRNVTNDGMARLRPLTQLTGLNLSSCSITDSGLAQLRDLPRVEYLNLAYCNRLSDGALKTLEAMRNLTYVDLQGCLGITRAALARVRRKNLTMYRG